MKNIIRTTLLIAGLFFLSNCSSDQVEPIAFQGEAIKVNVSQAQSLDDTGFSSASGKLVAKSSVNVSTRMMGYITSFPIEVGQQVTKGQLLVAINNTDIQAKSAQIDAQIMQAQANFDIAKKDYERFKNLFNSQSASQKELDDMSARFQMAKAGLEAAKQMKNEINSQYKYTNITAPVTGVVTSKFAQQGDLANPGMPLLSIESSSDLQAQLMVSESIISQLETGMPIDVIIKSTGEEVKGVIGEISPSSVQTGGQFIVKANIPNAKNLLAGMYVNAKFPVNSNRDSNSDDNSNVIIPKSALVKKGQLVGVYTISDQNTAILRWLKIGNDHGDQVEVLSGLQVGEKFIVSAEGRLYNGSLVKLN